MKKKLFLILSGATLLWVGCDSDSKPKKKTADSTEAVSDVPTDTFTYDEAAEFAIDADAFLNVNTKEDYHVATLYFEGGAGKNCAKWEITISSAELKLARGERLDATVQAKLMESAPGQLTGSFETHGAIPGIRMVVKKDTILTFIGKQSYCKGSDAAEFSVQENVEKSKMHEIFRGVEVKGIGFMTLKISDEKSLESVAKVKEQLAAAETPAAETDETPVETPVETPAPDPMP